MFDWLFEGRLLVYVILALLVGAFVGVWWAYGRRRGWLYAAGVVVVLIGVYFLLDRLVETAHEQVERKLGEMAAAVRRGDVGRIFEHISEQFRWQGMDKASFRAFVDGHLKSKQVDDLAIWDVKGPDERGEVLFSAKPKGPTLPDFQFRIVSEFVLESGGQWRLRTFQVRDPVTNQPITVPGT